MLYCRSNPCQVRVCIEERSHSHGSFLVQAALHHPRPAASSCLINHPPVGSLSCPPWPLNWKNSLSPHLRSVISHCMALKMLALCVQATGAVNMLTNRPAVGSRHHTPAVVCASTAFGGEMVSSTSRGPATNDIRIAVCPCKQVVHVHSGMNWRNVDCALTWWGRSRGAEHLHVMRGEPRLREHTEHVGIKAPCAPKRMQTAWQPGMCATSG